MDILLELLDQSEGCCGATSATLHVDDKIMNEEREKPKNDNMIDLDAELANLDIDKDFNVLQDEENDDNTKDTTIVSQVPPNMKEEKPHNRKVKLAIKKLTGFRRISKLKKEMEEGSEKDPSSEITSKEPMTTKPLPKPEAPERSHTTDTAVSAKSYTDDYFDLSNKETSTINHDHRLFKRNEVFSKHYKPSEMESKEIGKLVDDLQVKNALTGMLLKTSSPTALSQLFNLGEQLQPKYDPANCNNNNIIMKRGTVRVTVGSKTEELTGTDDVRILVLMTHGFVVSKQPPSTMKFGFGSFSPLVEQAHFFEKVIWIKDVWQLEVTSSQEKHPLSDNDDLKENDNSEKKEDDPSNVSKYAFSIHVEGQKDDMRFNCKSLEEKHSWLEAWERLLIQCRRSVSSATSATEDNSSTMKKGWQYELVQASLYTAAVTGQDFSGPYHLKQVNVLDQYNRLAPLHYAVIHNQIHIIHHLVDTCNANVEVTDKDGRTPMYYAERDEMKDAIEVLKGCGAEASDVFQREQHGALVEGARQLERIREEKIARTELMKGAAINKSDNSIVSQSNNHQSAAKSARSQMHEAMAGIRDRGKKIEELDEKTDELQENTQEFKSLASQIRSKLEKKNKGLNFLNPFTN